MQFQQDNGLTADGIAGHKTFAMLNELLGNTWNVPEG